mmetsp:Transcript_113556/g.220140  ORF Transcript_113556/g.220140 Transcript_113556/m.220140 type:complete len:621 (+) Transcript_113556:117-1979(+)
MLGSEGGLINRQIMIAPLGPALAHNAVLILHPLQDGQEPKKLPEPGGVLTIGRKATCEMVIAEMFPFVSGEHCRFCVSEDASAVTLEDMSGNGTYVNGTRIGKGRAVPVQVDDQVSLAKPNRKGGSLKFRIKAEAPSPVDPIGIVSSPVVVTPTPDPVDVVVPVSDVVAPVQDVVAAPAPDVVPTHETAAARAATLFAGRGADRRSTWTPPPVRRQQSEVPLQQASLPTANNGDEEASALIGAVHHVQQRDQDEVSRLRARREEETETVEKLSAELREARQRQEEQQERRRWDVIMHSDSELTAGNTRISTECELLSKHLARVREENSELQRSYPILEEAAAKHRRECSQLHVEVNAEKECAHRAELEAAALRLEFEEVTECALGFRSEMRLVTERNAGLEEQCAEASTASIRARTDLATARQRLEGRSAALSSLRMAVREHARWVGERLGMLEESLQEVQSQSSSPRTEANEAAVALSEAWVEEQRHGEDSRRINCEAPTLANHIDGIDEVMLRIDTNGGRSRTKGRVGAAVKVDSSLEEETPTQDADVAAGAPVCTMAAAVDVAAAWEGSPSSNGREGPRVKRRRTPQELLREHGHPFEGAQMAVAVHGRLPDSEFSS